MPRKQSSRLTRGKGSRASDGSRKPLPITREQPNISAHSASQSCQSKLSLLAIVGARRDRLPHFLLRLPLHPNRVQLQRIESGKMACLEILTAAAMAGLVSSLLVAVIFWPGLRNASSSSSNNASISSSARPKIFSAALWFLTLLAIPSAFVSLCAPGLLVSNYIPSMRNTGLEGWLLGLILGSTGVLVAVLLARGLWRDATRSPTRQNESPPARRPHHRE